MSARRRTTAIASVTATVAIATSVALSLGTTSASAASVATWDKVAQCESSGNWSINTGNGYYGGLQFSASTWRAFGGTAYAAYAHQATKKQQILIAEKVLAGQGPGAWPHCGRSAGLGNDHANPYPDAPTPPAPAQSWKTQVLVDSGNGLHHATRFADGTWTRFGNVEGEAAAVPGGVRAVAEAGINGDTHVLAVSNEGKLHHTVRNANGTWGTFGDVHAAAGALANVTQVAAASVGAELQVAVVADGKVYHTVRRADGNWTPLAPVGNPAGGKPVTKVALARTGSDVQLVAVADGVLHHTARLANGTWLGWGDVSAEGAPAGISDVAIAGTGNDLQLVLTAENGAKQYHGARFFSGEWVFNSLSSVVSGVTVTDVSAAAVNDELQVAFVAADGRVLHTVRQVSGNWTGVGTVDLTGVPATHDGVAVTGTFN
ncbi:transglycosylase family protein [Streptomyces sp. NPDC006512]|uniref:transglycosylase family protein n=1 Tax=Streptomyces sp. NPDC006512 TaxID=3154307 RepID=UPI0033A1017C